ncbi:MAG TPA: InlB B-repeat-containing protein [Acidimicrobiales bacterium]
MPTGAGLSNSGFTFKGWNTAADGTGISYAAGSSFVLNANQTFYAQWTPIPTHTATFVINGGIGSVASITDPVGTSVLLPSVSGVSNTGYTFTGWNTAANGSGSSFAEGASYALNADQTFYAQWIADQYTVTFASLGGILAPSTNNYVVGDAPLTLPLPTLPNNDFNGWYTALSGGTLVGIAGAPYVPEASITLYADWSAKPLIDLGFDANGASGSLSPLSGTSGASVTLPGSSSLKRSGFSLTAWNTSASGTGTPYALGQVVVLSNALTLFAQWTPMASISIDFKSEGGSGSISSLDGFSGSSVTLPGVSDLVKSGFILTSWNTAVNGKGTTYALGASVTLSTSLTLYAQWRESRSPVLYGAVSKFAKDSSVLSKAMKKQVHRLAVAVKDKKFKQITLYGYTAATGLASLDRSLSDRRAAVVADYLQTELRDLKVKGVSVSAAGEGSIKGNTSPAYSRVEVFVL